MHFFLHYNYDIKTKFENISSNWFYFSRKSFAMLEKKERNYILMIFCISKIVIRLAFAAEFMQKAI